MNKVGPSSCTDQNPRFIFVLVTGIRWSHSNHWSLQRFSRNFNLIHTQWCPFFFHFSHISRVFSEISGWWLGHDIINWPASQRRRVVSFHHFAKLLRTTRLAMYFGWEKTRRRLCKVLAKSLTLRYIKNGLNKIASGLIKILQLILQLVSWYFEPSPPQRITSGLKQTSICLLFFLHTRHQTTNSQKTTTTKKKTPKNPHRISPNTNLHKQNIHKYQTQHFWRISPFCFAPVKKST